MAIVNASPPSYLRKRSGVTESRNEAKTAQTKGDRKMLQPNQTNTVNPDIICNQVMLAKMNVYQAKEQFEAVLKVYNDHIDGLINLVNMMKNRILELEGEIEKHKKGKEIKNKEEK